MRCRLLWLCLLAVTSAFSAPATPEPPANLAIDGAARIGVYKGAGCAGAPGVQKFERWLGRDTDLVLEFISWPVLQDSSTWAVRCWAAAGRKSVVYSLPMLPPDHSATLAQGAQGKFDQLFSNYGAALVKNGYANAVIRIGWEFNAEWYAWAASKDPESWVAYWRRIVSVLRAVPGQAFTFDWNPAAAAGGFAPERVYPGDDVVDIIGLDFYNTAVDARSFTPQQRWETRMNMRTGLKWQRDFAAQHNKPMSFPKWGTGVRAKGGGAEDDAYFVEQMAAWIAGNNVTYHGYWDYGSKEYNSILSDGRQPKAGAAFKRAFSANGKSSSTHSVAAD